MTLEHIYKEGIDKINKIYDIFKDYFGEDRVDLQNIITLEEVKDKGGEYYLNNLTSSESPFIIVHFPLVTVRNEYNQSVEIKNLWAKVSLTFKGRIMYGFSLNRTHYPVLHWMADYMHSHVSGIYKSNLTVFSSPCLGEGPIKSTITSLGYNYSEELWLLFCRELDVYVGVESIAGVPYRKMANIAEAANNRNSVYISDFTSDVRFNVPRAFKHIIDGFIPYIISSRKLKFNYCNGIFNIAMDYFDYHLTISNLFIEWFNDYYNNVDNSITLNTLRENEIIIPVNISGRKIYKHKNSVRVELNSVENTKILTFKGKDILLEIDYDNIHLEEASHVLNKLLSNKILRIILMIINYKYGRKENKENTASCVSIEYLL